MTAARLLLPILALALLAACAPLEWEDGYAYSDDDYDAEQGPAYYAYDARAYPPSYYGGGTNVYIFRDSRRSHYHDGRQRHDDPSAHGGPPRRAEPEPRHPPVKHSEGGSRYLPPPHGSVPTPAISRGAEALRQQHHFMVQAPSRPAPPPAPAVRRDPPGKSSDNDPRRRP